MASLDEIIQDRVKHYNREITDLTSQAKSLGLSNAEINSLRVQAVRGRDKSRRYFEQHEQDLSQFQDAALDPIRQELGAQRKEILGAAARGEITSKEQLETGSLAQTAAGNYRSALRRGERIAQLGTSALQAANRRAVAEDKELRRRIENQKRRRNVALFGAAAGIGGLAIGGYGLIGGAGGAKAAGIGLDLGQGLGSLGGAFFPVSGEET